MNAVTTLTLEQTLMRDLELVDSGKAEIRFGKLYYAGLRTLFTSADSIFATLSAGAGDDSVVDPRLHQVLCFLSQQQQQLQQQQ